MAWYSAFLEKVFPAKATHGTISDIVIDIPAELYYKELALQQAISLISNAISLSEIKTFHNGQSVKVDDYYLLNVSPNLNETSSVFWHKVINKTIREGQALVVEADHRLYCADSYTLTNERPILGDVYSGVTVGSFQFGRVFTIDDYYLFTLDNISIKSLIDSMYDEYGKIISAAAQSFKKSNGQKYKLHIEGVQAGDQEFQQNFENVIKKQLKSYIENENAVYPEFDGYQLTSESGTGKTADDYIKLRTDLFKMVAGALHIPESMMTGNITNMKEIVSAFLTFGVDPYADMITEGLNKRAGLKNYMAGNYYRVDTGRILHRDVFEIASGVTNLISSGVYSIDEVRDLIGADQLGEDWSGKHFITKNFDEINRFLTEGGV